MKKNTVELAKQFANEKFSEIGKKNHYLEVFEILSNDLETEDEQILIAGLLHDTLEDTSTTYEEIVSLFSKDVADIVQEVSHPKNYNEQEKLEYYEKIKEISNGAKLVKVADFISHMRHFIEIYKKNEQHLYPKFKNNDKYIASIREFLDSSRGIRGEVVLRQLTSELESFL